MTVSVMRSLTREQRSSNISQECFQLCYAAAGPAPLSFISWSVNGRLAPFAVCCRCVAYLLVSDRKGLTADLPRCGCKVSANPYQIQAAR